MTQKTIEAIIGDDLRRLGWKLAAAESLTGGLIGHMITNIPGSSAYYAGSVTAYANETKAALLGVPPETLEKFGAVSEETALAMAGGVRKALKAEAGVAVTGIAGPDGAEPGKPVGLVWIAVSTPLGEQAWMYHFPGDRLQNKAWTAETALNLLHLMLLQSWMEAVEVHTRMDHQGRVIPVEFTWHGASQRIESTGRRQIDGAGEHILCRTYDGATFTLFHAEIIERWFVEKAAPARAAA